MNVYRNLILSVLSVTLLGASQARADDKEDLQKILGDIGELRKASEKDQPAPSKPAQETREMVEAFKTLAAEAVKVAQARTAEAKVLQKALDESRKELLKSQEQANEMKNKLVVAEIELQATKKTCQTFEKLVVQMEKRDQRISAAIEQSGNSGAEPRLSTGVDPHADATEKEVHGKIAGIADAGLYVVSIGTDEGVKPGQTMEVFRADDKSKHLGAITVVRAYANQAIGQFKADNNERAQLGDDVTAKIALK